MDELKNVLIKLELNYCTSDIINLLFYFRNKFTQHVFKYVGDSELYNIIISCVIQGHDFKTSCAITKEIINREFNFANHGLAAGRGYSFNFRPKASEFNLKSEEIKALINNMPKERWWKIIINRIEYHYQCWKQSFLQNYL